MMGLREGSCGIFYGWLMHSKAHGSTKYSILLFLGEFFRPLIDRLPSNTESGGKIQDRPKQRNTFLLSHNSRSVGSLTL